MWTRTAYVLASFVMPVACAAAPCNPPSEIHFVRGSSGATVNDAIARGEIACWTVQARKGQTIEIHIASPENNAVFQIYRPGWTTGKARDGGTDLNGTTMVGAGEGDDTKQWTGKLDESGSVLIVIGATRGGAPYQLRVAAR